MNFEVEQKFAVTDFDAVATAVAALGGQFGSAQVQTDRYFNHPGRDFGQTDEALRIRSCGQENCVTYKGPKINAATKTRKEIEIPIASGAGATKQFGRLLESLGFRPVRVVEKSRRVAKLNRDSFEVEIALDEVISLGKFVEIELIANEEALDAATAELLHLAGELQLAQSERRSYLELLLLRDS